MIIAAEFRRFLVLLMSVSIAVLLISCSFAGKAKEEAIASMGGENVELSLFKKIMDDQAYNVRVQFDGEYGIKLGDDPKEWEKEYKEGTPLDMLKELSLDEAEKTKAILLVARDRGLIKTTAYGDILKYDNESLKNAFKVKINEAEIGNLSIYDRDVFLRFMEIVKYELKKDVRNTVDREDIEDYVKKHGAGAIKDYVRISPGAEKDESRLVDDIVSNEQKFSVLKDLVRDDKYNGLIEQKIKSSATEVNEEVYRKVTFS